MPKGARKGHKYRTKFLSKCAWCGENFGHIDPDKESCSPSCRQRLDRFRVRFGFDPEKPPGKKQSAEVIRDKIEELITRERLRLTKPTGPAPAS